jgi:hypothetical protein
MTDGFWLLSYMGYLLSVKAEMAELGDAADSKSDSTVFHNLGNTDRNHANTSQILFSPILSFEGFSVYYLMFW